MKKLFVFLIVMILVLGVIGSSYALEFSTGTTLNRPTPGGSSLTTIGTATYDGSNYNLIYEDDSIYGGLVWLDYTNDYGHWLEHANWASGLNTAGVLTYNLNPGVNVTWGGDWRLPITDESVIIIGGGFGYEGADQNGEYGYDYGYNMINSEMGHLYYESLENLGKIATDGTEDPDGWGFQNAGPFNNLFVGKPVYWSGKEYSGDPSEAWGFNFEFGYQGHEDKPLVLPSIGPFGVAVRPGDVSIIPIPSAICLLGAGLIGLVGFRRKFWKVTVTR